MDKETIARFDASLERCTASPEFADRFYDRFLASSPKVRQRFAKTDFARQKRALRASLNLMLLVAADEEKGPARYLGDIAERHSKRDLDIGAELYDLWLDTLLETVKECDPQFSPEVERAWERVMMVGISYLLLRYGQPGSGA